MKNVIFNEKDINFETSRKEPKIALSTLHNTLQNFNNTGFRSKSEMKDYNKPRLACRTRKPTPLR